VADAQPGPVLNPPLQARSRATFGRDRGAEASARNAETFERLLLEHRDAIAHDDPELAVDVAFRLVYSTLARRVMRGEAFESRRPLTWQQLVDELGEACVRYLLRS